MPATDSPASATQAQLVVRPFRGLRYDPAAVSDLAAVTSPPYDVIDADSATHLEQLDPHNVVRLILPRAGGSGRYAQAAQALRQWQAEGVLRRDQQPALYVYEQEGPGVRQRGVIAAVGLHDPHAGVILPHEDVMPGPVADRLELMRATEANLEPILLVYDGGGATADLVDRTAETPPLLETTAQDGLVQRLWAVTDPLEHELVANDLAPRQALIADGHHRYATYRRLQAEHAGTVGTGGGATDAYDLGLALLVDRRSHPLHVGAIHRVVPGLRLDAAVAAAAPVFTVDPAGADLTEALSALDAATAAHPFVLTDGERFLLLSDPDPAAVERALPAADHSPSWRSLDASVLHAVLLDRLWGVPDTHEGIGYLHDEAGAVRAAARGSGVAVLMRPVRVETVEELAAAGERMPRKSTSFGPKPRTGLVLRTLED